MEQSSQFTQMMTDMNIFIHRTKTGIAPRVPPCGWTWHHAQQQGMMQLVPRFQHTPGSIFWNTLHPAGQGGYAIWGK